MNSPTRRVVIVDDDLATVKQLVAAFERQSPADLAYLGETHTAADDS